MVILATLATVIASQALDLRRLLHGPAVHADVVPAAHDGAAHVQHRGGGRSSCRKSTRILAVGVLILVLSVPQQRRAGLGVRDRGDGHVPVHVGAGDGGVSGGATGGRARRWWRCSAGCSWWTSCSLRRTRSRSRRGGLGAADAGPGDHGDDDVVEPGAGADAGAVEAGQPAADVVSCAGCRSRAPCGCRGLRCS